MSNKTMKFIAIAALFFMAVFTVTFTIGLYINFKEPYNSIAIFSIMLAMPLWFVVYLESKRRKNAAESKKQCELEDENAEKENQAEQSKDTIPEENTDISNKG